MPEVPCPRRNGAINDPVTLKPASTSGCKPPGRDVIFIDLTRDDDSTKLYTFQNGSGSVCADLFGSADKEKILQAFELSLEKTSFEPEKT
ncbi:hypothetical protein B0T26DRAFT_756980 [Lasiosphaeria miniovina]|uniref:Uncharacterized protein n=1 Tax=Lasiosphaeria miniovina TaxID=1954250 RepID=A0AA39ZTR1_9PEZI|nr:uncharacterized protein B0T26DRAFT_756980 [Lasiosphaeria miniovina]KAK0703421.1 hypothetical protein B0T26DRAFT_756980 [Lasiosphaeria miniovina]